MRSDKSSPSEPDAAPTMPTIAPMPAPTDHLPPEAQDAVDPSAKPRRFTYASGERPLDGYTIKRGVGSGGFGEVYFAVSDAGKEVALKLIRRNLEVELRGVKECLNLKHPNLVALFDIRTDDHDDQWVVMEYVSGASLEEVIDRYPDGMPQDMALEWFSGIASAVAYLHDHGIVHRDLKPANIFIDEGGVKIGDYGLAKFISCSRRSGQTESVGTVHYMAPEIANGRYGREIDTYALGIIFYEMLTGHVPFEGESVGEVLMKHLTAEPDLAVLADPYREIVRGAMAKDPDQRIKNVADMISLLQASGAIDPSKLHAVATARLAETPAPGTPRATDPVEPAAVGSMAETVHLQRGEEPVAAAIRSLVRTFAEVLQFDKWDPVSRVVGLTAATIGLVFTAGLWVRPLLAAGLVYFFYYPIYLAVRAVSRMGGRRGAADPPVQAPPGVSPDPPDVPPRPLATPPTLGQAVVATHVAGSPVPEAQTPKKKYPRRPWRRRKRTDWRQVAYRELAAKPLRTRGGELIGSMLLAGLIATVVSLGVTFFATGDFDAVFMVWTAVVVTVASWAIMGPSKWAEGRIEDQAPMRFTQLLVGAGVGGFAWLMAAGMLLPMPASSDWSIEPDDSLTAGVFGLDGSFDQAFFHENAVSLPAPSFVAYFALIFLLVGWWRQAEAVRGMRVNVWSILWCGFVAWLLTLFFWFPQPTGLLLAMAIAVTIQFSSPWLPPSRRRELAEAAAAEATV